MKREDASRYHLRGGMAKIAMRAKLSGDAVRDAGGNKLKYANEMADRHSISQIEAWSKNPTPKVTVDMRDSYGENYERIFGHA